jgi:hypothetical protein
VVCFLYISRAPLGPLLQLLPKETSNFFDHGGNVFQGRTIVVSRKIPWQIKTENNKSNHHQANLWFSSKFVIFRIKVELNTPYWIISQSSLICFPRDLCYVMLFEFHISSKNEEFTTED